MKKQINSLLLNRRRAGVIAKLACAVLLTTTAAVCATGSDGVTLINQAAVQAAGGFPYVINQAGSYRLSGDLIVATNATAIAIHTSNVTLDLNGFTVGCNNCSGVSGIDSHGSGTTIVNGLVQGFRGGANVGGAGIHFLGTSAKVDRVTVSNNEMGIVAEDGVDLSVTNSSITSNGFNGISTGNGLLIVSNCFASRNGTIGQGDGIYTGGVAQVTGSVLADNSGYGVELNYVTGSANVTNNAIYRNNVGGVYANPPTWDPTLSWATEAANFGVPALSQ